MHVKRIPPPRRRTPSEYQALGRAIEELRVRSGLSQAALAKRCRTCRSHISALERGQGNPTFHTVLRLLDGLDAAFEQLVATYNRHWRPPEDALSRWL